MITKSQYQFRWTKRGLSFFLALPAFFVLACFSFPSWSLSKRDSLATFYFVSMVCRFSSFPRLWMHWVWWCWSCVWCAAFLWLNLQLSQINVPLKIFCSILEVAVACLTSKLYSLAPLHTQKNQPCWETSWHWSYRIKTQFINNCNKGMVVYI